LRGGEDSWDEIDHVLRNDAFKQIVVFTKHVSKPGVKKELAIGDVMKAKLVDPKFMIGVRNDDVSFSDAPPAGASSFEQAMPVAYDVPFADFISGNDLGPYFDRASANNDVVNLLRQHFDLIAAERGLRPVEFGSGQAGWFFPDGLVAANKVVCDAPDGRRIRRAVSGKFKALRWHLCLVAKPRIWPTLVYGIHANVVLSKDSITPLPGDKTHRRRVRLTRSWWNDVWRDRLVAAMSFLAGNHDDIIMETGHEKFSVARWPITAQIPVSYEATDPPLPSEEDEDGNIIPNAALDDQIDDLEDEENLDSPAPAGDPEGRPS
jgi:hypothetical protein